MLLTPSPRPDPVRIGKDLERRSIPRLETILRWMAALDLNIAMQVLLEEVIDELGHESLRLQECEQPSLPLRSSSATQVERTLVLRADSPDVATRVQHTAFSEDMTHLHGGFNCAAEIAELSMGDEWDDTDGKWEVLSLDTAQELGAQIDMVELLETEEPAGRTVVYDRAERTVRLTNRAPQRTDAPLPQLIDEDSAKRHATGRGEPAARPLAVPRVSNAVTVQLSSAGPVPFPGHRPLPP